jgi:exopolyphosphatase/guanosine-5'-triphosphate,3'-diphosphate pyrophosphatase
MLCAAIDIGSNTTRVLVAEPDEGQLRKVMEQRAYTRIGKATTHDGAIDDDKVAEVAEVVTTQVRLAEEVGAEAIRIVATAAIREATNSDEAVAAVSRACGHPVEILSDRDEGRLAFLGATKTLGHPVDGSIGVVDVGGGSSEIVLGSVSDGASDVLSFKIGSGSLSDDFLKNDPPTPSEIRALRERAVRVLASDPVADVAKRFELDPRRVRLLPSGVLLLEKLSELLGQPLQIGKGGLREGIILDLLNGASNGHPAALAA